MIQQDKERQEAKALTRAEKAAYKYIKHDDNFVEFMHNQTAATVAAAQKNKPQNPMSIAFLLNPEIETSSITKGFTS